MLKFKVTLCGIWPFFYFGAIWLYYQDAPHTPAPTSPTLQPTPIPSPATTTHAHTKSINRLHAVLCLGLDQTKITLFNRRGWTINSAFRMPHKKPMGIVPCPNVLSSLDLSDSVYSGLQVTMVVDIPDPTSLSVAPAESPLDIMQVVWDCKLILVCLGKPMVMTIGKDVVWSHPSMRWLQ